MSVRRAVFLDRDGTIIVHRPYLSDPDHVELLPNAIQGLRLLQRQGLGLIVVTNQAGVGRGYFDDECVRQIHHRLRDLLAAHDIELDGVFYCPHSPDDVCNCRKPRTGLIHQATRQFGFDPRDGFMIGDNVCDIELGRNVGATTLLVRTGYGSGIEATGDVRSDYVVDDLVEASVVIEKSLTVA